MAEFKYRVSAYRRFPITRVEIIRQTEKTIWLRDRWYGSKGRRVLKRDRTEEYFDTWDEAAAALETRADRHAKHAERNYLNASENLERCVAFRAAGEPTWTEDGEPAPETSA
ncbi:MAG: hypothetical protein AAF205_00170 [Pseudomonadota bacterium]